MAKTFLTNIDLKGNQLLNAVIQPSGTPPSNPVAGQIYFDTNLGYLRTYDGTNWINSSQGIQGIQGLQGIQGVQGTQGIQGTQGLQGLQGVQGTQGTQGLQGIQGIQGEQGLQGIQGVQGIQGLQGIQGVQGTQGLQGVQGTQGIQGIQGVQGTQGIQGTNAGILSTDSSLLISAQGVLSVDTTVIASKSYVDSTAQGLFVIGSVRAASDSLLDLTSATPIVGGVTLANNDRVLIKDQTTKTQNGIYTYNSTTSKLVASTNVEDTALKEGSFVFVEEGTSAARGYIITSYVANASTWTQFSAAGEYTAGNGITISDGAISTKYGDGLTVSGSTLVVDTSKVVYKATADITPVTPFTATTFSINHALNSSNVEVIVYSYATSSQVETDVTISDNNHVIIGFGKPPASGETYKVVVQA